MYGAQTLVTARPKPFTAGDGVGSYARATAELDSIATTTVRFTQRNFMTTPDVRWSRISIAFTCALRLSGGRSLVHLTRAYMRTLRELRRAASPACATAQGCGRRALREQLAMCPRQTCPR